MKSQQQEQEQQRGAPSPSSRKEEGEATGPTTSPTPSVIRITEDAVPTASTTVKTNELQIVTDTSDTSSASSPGPCSSTDESSTMRGATSSKRGTREQVTPNNSFAQRWKRGVRTIHKPLMAFLRYVTRISATYPKLTISGVMSVSFLLLFIGFSTNFFLEVDQDRMWTPRTAQSLEYSNWLKYKSGFIEYQGAVVLLLHADGDNILTKEYMSQVFDAWDVLLSVPGREQACTDTDYTYENVTTCEISGAHRFWRYQREEFERTIGSDEDLRLVMSQINFPDGTYVDEHSIMGYPQRDNVTLTGSAFGYNATLLLSALSIPIVVVLPNHELSQAWEKAVLETMLDLQEQWNSMPASEKHLKLFVQSGIGFTSEFKRGILADMPLVLLVFITMSVFTCLIFARRNPVFSRSLLGFAAVVSVLLAIMAGYGFMFITGVPFTSLTQLLPFILFGIGIDDAIILIDSFSRTDLKKDAVQRIRDTIDDCGISISLTTITSAVAFGLSAISSLDAITWLALYACPTVVLILLWQLTFFVACIVLDERRVSQGRRDCCIWSKAKDFDVNIEKELRDGRKPLGDRFMTWYADKLLRPCVKLVVAIGFVVLTVMAAVSASKLTQSFEARDVLPSDSFILDFEAAAKEYSSRLSAPTRAVFRFVDQSDENIQQQMLEYMKEMSEMDSVREAPKFFWLWHFNEFLNQTGLGDEVPFNEKLASFLDIQIFHDLYGKEIILDDDGNIVTSRGYFFMDNVGQSVRDQIGALSEQQVAMARQPINQGTSTSEYPFISFNGVFNLWEFYSRCAGELTSTTFMSVIAVVVVAAMLIPHWTAWIFSLPLVCVLYIDLLGALQWAGIHINAVTYIGLSMSIGLLVDYVMHVLMRYYELKGTRQEKTVEMLRTMGVSILIGGISTFLGTMLLAFSSTRIFYTIFVTFIGIVTIGLGHGLILLPVILSTIGPEDESTGEDATKTESVHPKSGSPRKQNIKFEI